MYVTRPLSLYRRFPRAALEPPSEGPNSGYLVLFDGESEAEATNCWGLTKDRRVWNLPLSQNKIMAVRDANDDEDNEKKVVFIPVINEPLSSKHYYVIVAHGKYKGHACTCSREEDMDICCLCSYVNDVKPRARPCTHGSIPATTDQSTPPWSFQCKVQGSTWDPSTVLKEVPLPFQP